MTLYVNNGTALWPGFALRLGSPLGVDAHHAAPGGGHLISSETARRQIIAHWAAERGKFFVRKQDTVEHVRSM
jgi:hypothetical protein